MYSDIRQGFEKAGIKLQEKQLAQLDAMTVFLQEYCKKVNLTAIRDREGIIEKHLIDSVLPLTLFDCKKGEGCLDIGTGAGFPAVPMMIYRPDLRFTLLDALQKRTVYLSLLSEQLGISPEIIHGRAEELNRKDGYKGSYGMVTARAVADLPALLKYAVPFLKSGGAFLAMRGAKAETDAEVEKTAKRLGAEKTQEICYQLPLGEQRRLVLFRKK